jgi:hypothetical protein
MVCEIWGWKVRMGQFALWYRGANTEILEEGQHIKCVTFGQDENTNAGFVVINIWFCRAVWFMVCEIWGWKVRMGQFALWARGANTWDNTLSVLPLVKMRIQIWIWRDFTGFVTWLLIFDFAGPCDSWFVKFEDGKYAWDNLPYELEVQIHEIFEEGQHIKCVTFGPDETFVVVHDRCV